MPYKEKEIEQVYFTVGQVARQFNVATSLLRFWENEFKELNPKRNKKGHRLYSRKDIDVVCKIYNLVKVKGMNHEGAKRFLQGTQQERLEIILDLARYVDSLHQTQLAIRIKLDGEKENQH